jgi:hypothetical protein
MKRALITTAVFAFGTVLATAVFAQGRHDEKPHGSTKPSAEVVQYEPVPISGGRHDERPHGPRKAVVKKDESKGRPEASPKADECCR